MEFWALLGDEVSAEWLFDVLRTLRKRNAGLVGSSQSLAEIVNSPSRDLLLESSPAKVLLPNHELRQSSYVRDSYARLGLTDHEMNMLGNATPHRQYFFRSPIGSRLFTLELGDIGRAVCASTGYKDVARARELLAESAGADNFLNNWLAERNALAQVIPHVS